jgi:hypothetical protein
VKLYYIPAPLRCPTCHAALWTEGEPSKDGRMYAKCIARGCSRKDVRLGIQLPHVEAKEIEED